MSTLSELLDDTDDEVKAMAKEQQDDCQAQLGEAEDQLLQLLVPPEDADQGTALLEVHAGIQSSIITSRTCLCAVDSLVTATGGREAALFAGDLAAMYRSFCERQRWRWQTISSNSTDEGGLREMSVSISGHGAYGMLRVSLHAYIGSKPSHSMRVGYTVCNAYQPQRHKVVCTLLRP